MPFSLAGSLEDQVKFFNLLCILFPQQAFPLKTHPETFPIVLEFLMPLK